MFKLTQLTINTDENTFTQGHFDLMELNHLVCLMQPNIFVKNDKIGLLWINVDTKKRLDKRCMETIAKPMQ